MTTSDNLNDDLLQALVDATSPAMELVKLLANLDTDEDFEGRGEEMDGDDACATLNNLIRAARGIAPQETWDPLDFPATAIGKERAEGGIIGAVQHEGGPWRKAEPAAPGPARTRMVCATCGSDQVRRDAWAAWSELDQEWILAEYMDQAFCAECECECTIKEEPLSK